MVRQLCVGVALGLSLVVPVVAQEHCRNLYGDWYAYNPGINRQGASRIHQEGSSLILYNEVGQRHDGRFLDPDTLSVDVGSGQTLRGEVTNKGKRINWSNNTYWIRK